MSFAVFTSNLAKMSWLFARIDLSDYIAEFSFGVQLNPKGG